MPAKRLVASGYGEYHPIASNKTAAGRARNRRIEILLTPSLDPKAIAKSKLRVAEAEAQAKADAKEPKEVKETKETKVAKADAPSKSSKPAKASKEPSPKAKSAKSSIVEAPPLGAGADHPAGGGEADLRTVDVQDRRRVGPWRRPGAKLVIRLLEEAADGTELGEVTNQRVLGQCARHIDRLDIDLGPAALVEDPAHAVAVCESELARLVRSTGGEVRQERRGGVLGRRHERILPSAPPHDAAKPGAAPSRRRAGS